MGAAFSSGPHVVAACIHQLISRSPGGLQGPARMAGGGHGTRTGFELEKHEHREGTYVSGRSWILGTSMVGCAEPKSPWSDTRVSICTPVGCVLCFATPGRSLFGGESVMFHNKMLTVMIPRIIRISIHPPSAGRHIFSACQGTSDNDDASTDSVCCNIVRR